MSDIRKVGVIGLGYIGLPTAVILANHGLHVCGVDIHEAAIKGIAQGKAHIHEPGLDAALKLSVDAGRLKASLSPEPCDAFILAVPTPFKADHVPDLSYIEAATASIAPVLRPGNLVVLESTSPVGTTERLAEQLAAHRPDLTFAAAERTAPHDVHVTHCPERVLPGRIFSELVDNARVIGGICPCCTEKAIGLYKTFVKAECRATDARTAELVKLSENAFRDVNIAFANELSAIAQRLKVDPHELIALANLHPRVNILDPGTGVGGHCIAVDPWFIVHSAPKESHLIRTARSINDSKPKLVAEQAMKALDAMSSPRVACLGMSYKPDIDDIRESPSIHVIELLIAAGVTPILVHDPYVLALPKNIQSPGVKLCSLPEILAESNVVLLLTNHREYQTLSPNSLAGKILIDPSGTFHHRTQASRR